MISWRDIKINKSIVLEQLMGKYVFTNDTLIDISNTSGNYTEIHEYIHYSCKRTREGHRGIF